MPNGAERKTAKSIEFSRIGRRVVHGSFDGGSRAGLLRFVRRPALSQES